MGIKTRATKTSFPCDSHPATVTIGVLSRSVYTLGYGNTGCGVFKRGIQNQKDFCLLKNQHTQRKLLNFENWEWGPQKLSKIRVLKVNYFHLLRKKIPQIENMAQS